MAVRRLGLWYASGAAHWYNISLGLLWSKLPLHFDVAAYASRVDALAESTHMSNETKNGLNASLSSWYADGALHLSGFFFAETNPELSYLLLRGTPSPQVTGFALQHGQLYRFQEDPAGAYKLMSAVCPVSDTEDFRAMPFSNLLYLPNTDQIARAVVTALVPPAPDTSRHSTCRVVQRINGFLLLADRRELVERMRRADRPIIFYRQ